MSASASVSCHDGVCRAACQAAVLFDHGFYSHHGRKAAVQNNLTRAASRGATASIATQPACLPAVEIAFLGLTMPDPLAGAVARIRNALATATHTFFQQHGFLYVHTPIVTCSDCEGAGEMFQVGVHTNLS